jgi:hypothetical protein
MPLVLITSSEWNAMVSTIDDIAATVKRIDQTTRLNAAMESNMVQTLDDVLTDITELSTKEDGLIALMRNLKASVDEAIKGTVTPEQQAKIDQAFSLIEQRKAAVQAAIDEGTPPSPPPVDPNAPHPEQQPA